MIHSKSAGKLMNFKSLNFTFQWTYLSDYVTSLARACGEATSLVCHNGYPATRARR